MNNSLHKLHQYLQSQNLVSIATRNDKLWVSVVYYVVDDKLNLYFLSEPTTEHCQNILKNAEVACAIFNSNQKVTDKKIGVQLHGKASKVNNIKTIKFFNEALYGSEGFEVFEF